MRRLLTRAAAFAGTMALVLGAAVAASAQGDSSAQGDAATAAQPSGGPGAVNVVPAGAWSDQNGNLAQLHGVGILKDGGTYYAFGEDKVAGGTYTAVACYSSTDLVSWTRHADALGRQADGDLGPNRVVERPKVIRNPRTGQYVMYMHIDSSNYGDARVGVATSSTPCGPYSYRGSFRPLGQISRDLGLFQDTDGSAYLLSEDRANGLRVDRLSDDYLSVTSAVAVLPDMEAPAMVKVDGTYYLFGSQLTGWNTNDNAYATATSPAGPWSAWKPFTPAGSHTFNSQTSYVLPVTGRHGTTFVYIGDRWYPSHLYDSAPVWLPLSIKDGTASLSWQRAWSLDLADGTWQPQRTYSTYEADSDGTASGGAGIVTCTACTGGTGIGGIGLGGGAASYTYDDTDAALHYTGAWTHASGQSWSDADYGRTESYSTTAGDSVETSFTGTAVRWIGPKNSNGGIAQVYLDGTQVATVDTYAATDKQFQQVLYAASGLTAGQHTLKIVVTGQKNAASTATTVVVDAVDVPDPSKPVPTGTLEVDHVTVKEPGDYTVEIGYANPDAGNRYAYLSANGGTPVRIAFPTTGGTGTVATAVARIHLMPGADGNRLRLTNPDGPAPVIDTVAVPQPAS
ncbi:family 43 glycosylhydrolase [Streptomyces sp. NPDC020917]|uniref:family 43 glycosylhydrolase n=1 Tax=Streptomyces sp. NPDC020917 TaxID=3365102 RepID=UPI0037A76FC6